MAAAIIEARRAKLAQIEPQTFAAESDRARLSNVAVKAFIALSKASDLSNAEASHSGISAARSIA